VVIQTSERRTEVGVADLKYAYVQVHLERLRHAREIGDLQRFDSIIEAIHNDPAFLNSPYRTEVTHFLKHQVALACLSGWDDEELNSPL
jgi:hypothetical protein